MIRTFTILLGCLWVVGAAVLASESGPWFDPEKCDFCKAFAAQPGLFDHMTHEYHMLHNGMLQVTHIDTEYEPAFAKAQQGVGAVIKDMRAGKQITTCRHCGTLNSLFVAGVMPDEIRSGDFIYSVYTSTDTTMVKKIQEFGKTSADYFAAMAAKKPTDK